jgi:hypothetical protein
MNRWIRRKAFHKNSHISDISIGEQIEETKDKINFMFYDMNGFIR